MIFRIKIRFGDGEIAIEALLLELVGEYWGHGGKYTWGHTTGRDLESRSAIFTSTKP